MSSAQYQRLDSDEERLPEGMERIGYDADEQRYTYRDNTDGSLWESEEGQRYGKLHPVGHRPSISASEAAVTAGLLKANERAAWRYMLPFLLIAGAFLLFIIRITHSSGNSGSGDSDGKWPEPLCEKGQDNYKLVRGDTCWDLADSWGVHVDDLLRANEDLDCDALPVGRPICVPTGTKAGFGTT